ncbi:hydroxyethylthiazole kinase-like uncharacterized protein yjeF/hydroxyethylthiazole kinase-like uncharacterized protein yjeF [Maribacter vaceletii]|uniref:Bifunctional NAD(P)H-hydrate repair enzyme n=1 Tax=Maribacter vaceletii TaxID=1206816 RepID=A0A495DWT0_9FLAO|nr:NAD(P)H-hydrate dehydratase [Maribacter vaceletii]RKR08067.1 hydroxyethylthiazole kinase-like uncharacterized protein yjeF/hydroxyethylthiazole kinase-like uncharacterized protein yjeF [Maribacter vaceletii]
MKLFAAEQIYAADKFTIEKQQITSDALMEQAAIQIFNWMHLRMQGAPVKIHLFCGIGNNGGDGMALARHLQEHGYNIGVHVVNYSEKRSKDFLINLDRLKDRKIWPNFIDSNCEFPEIHKDDIIVDAIFGIGLNREPSDWVVNLIDHLHKSEAFVLSVDIPSGLYTDKISTNEKAIVKANYVLSFQAPKLIFFLPDTGIYIGQWEVLDIGLDPEYLSATEVEYEIIGKNEVLPMYKPREKYTHKGTYGHSLLIGGSYGKIGASILATKASLKIGSGLATAYVPKCGYIPLQTAVPEAMVLTNSEEYIADISYKIEPNAIGVGVGLGTEKETVDAFSKFLDSNKLPLVVDADGLNILSENKKLLKKLPENSILTPHPKELERLIGVWKGDFDKLKKAKAFSKKYTCVLIIKGANTITLFNGKVYINTTGNPGMATAGTGDVLTGVITGLMAQGYDSLSAAIFGVYLHGRAGDMVVEQVGYQSLMASDILEALGDAYIDLFKVPEQAPPQQEQQQEEG